MNDNLALPTCIHATRIGYWPESEYDQFGLLAPVTWRCDCGAKLTLERYDENFEFYVPISQEAKDLFLAEHAACHSTAKCFNCRTAPVDRYGDWCDTCS
jgi:hypothetical protein